MGLALSEVASASLFGAIQLSPKRQLFVDSYLIDKMEGVRRTLHQPTKLTRNPIVIADRPWEMAVRMNGVPSVVHGRESGLFKMWYFAYSIAPDEHGVYPWTYRETYYPAYAVSKDGLVWEKPSLGLMEFKGSKQNNLIPWASQMRNGSTNVLYDLHDSDPARRYKSAFDSYLPKDTWREGGLYVSFSPDGLHWHDYSGNPVLTRKQIDDAQPLLGWDERSRKYVGFFRPPFTVRTIGRSESSDFIHWTDPAKQVVLRPDSQDPKGTEFYYISVLAYEDMYIGLLWIYHNDPPWPWPKGTVITDAQLSGDQQLMDTQLAVSRDGVKWERVADRKVFLPLGPVGAWDDSMLFPTTPLVVGDEIWIYYGGSNMKHTYESLAKVGKKTGGRLWTESVGLAKLRLDGFISVDAGEKEGTLVTNPVSFSGDKLWLNLNASRGSILVEILDDKLHPIPGFTRADALLLRTNSLRQQVTWRSRSSLLSLSGRPIRLKFHLQNAELYSFWVSP
jgi:hypothetical protein